MSIAYRPREKLKPGEALRSSMSSGLGFSELDDVQWVRHEVADRPIILEAQRRPSAAKVQRRELLAFLDRALELGRPVVADL